MLTLFGATQLLTSAAVGVAAFSSASTCQRRGIELGSLAAGLAAAAAWPLALTLDLALVLVLALALVVVVILLLVLASVTA